MLEHGHEMLVALGVERPEPRDNRADVGIDPRARRSKDLSSAPTAMAESMLIGGNSRPAASAASSILALPSVIAPNDPRYCNDGSHPSAFSPVSCSIRGLSAPSQMAMSWAGAGPRFAPSTR